MTSTGYHGIEDCQRILGYTFSRPELLEEALTHASLRSAERRCNERLEFLGDAVLGLVIADYLFNTFDRLAEGELSIIRSTVVSRHSLARRARALQLDKYLCIGPGFTEHQHISDSMLANAFEAIIGAIYQDAGLAPAQTFILRHLYPSILEAIREPGKSDYKSLLQHWSQKYLKTTPQYELIEVTGPSHKQQFTMKVVIGQYTFGPCCGRSKRKVQQRLAHTACIYLGSIITISDSDLLTHFLIPVPGAPEICNATPEPPNVLSSPKGAHPPTGNCCAPSDVSTSTATTRSQPMSAVGKLRPCLPASPRSLASFCAPNMNLARPQIMQAPSSLTSSSQLSITRNILSEREDLEGQAMRAKTTSGPHSSQPRSQHSKSVSEHPKSRLQQLAHSRGWPTPTYRFISRTGPEHNQCYRVAVCIGTRVFTPASGRGKKQAERNAAQKALEILCQD